MSEGQQRVPFVAATVANDIAARILHGEFRPGDRLPDPWALADEYGIWFETMREVIKRLVIRELVAVAPSLNTTVTGHARMMLDNVHDRQRRLRVAIDNEAMPLLHALDRGDERAKRHLLAVGQLLVQRGLSYAGESGVDVGGAAHAFRILVRDADMSPDA